MQIELSSAGELLELELSGVLDNDSATHLSDAIDDAVHDGWHRVLVRLTGITYLSSAGISVLLAAKKQFAELHGVFGICDLQPDVERVLQQTRVLDGLTCDPDSARKGSLTGTATRMSKMRVASEDGVELQIFRIKSAGTFQCELVGTPQSFHENTHSLTECSCTAVSFPQSSIGLGLGALGTDFESSRSRFGEFLSVAGTVAQSAPAGSSLPDYQISRGEFSPTVQTGYGIKCHGEFSHLIRFNATDTGQPIPLKKLVRQSMQTIETDLATVVLLAECSGLVGTQLRQSPVTVGVDSDDSRFEFPQIREWLSYSSEQVHRRTLALCVGIASSEKSGPKGSTLQNFLRPMEESESLSGHFHAAVFPYRPLKKRTLDLHVSVTDLFDSGSIQDVLHLLTDNRPINGAGESEFIGGACWIGPIKQPHMEGSA